MKKLLFGSITLFIVLLLTELSIKLLQLDYKLISSTTYYVEGDHEYLDGEEQYEAIDDEVLLYRPIPGKTVTCKGCQHPDEKEFRNITFSNTELGGRKVDGYNSKAKKTLLWVGGSFSVGASVIQKWTLPSQLQRFFNETGRDIKVVDLSAFAYVTTQKIRRIGKYVKDHGIPEYIVLHNFNGGVRAFFYQDQNKARHFEKNSDLILEHFPNLFNFSLHSKLVAISSFYRMILAMTLHGKIKEIDERCKKDFGEDLCVGTNRDKIEKEILGVARYDLAFNIGQRHNELAKEGFYKKYLGKTRILEFIHTYYPCKDESKIYELEKKGEGAFFLNFCKGRPSHPHYFEVHPPAYVYRWYGDHFKEIFSRYLLL